MLVSPCPYPSLCSSSSCCSVISPDQKTSGTKECLHQQRCDVTKVDISAQQLVLLPTKLGNHDTDKRKPLNNNYYFWCRSSREARRPHILPMHRTSTAAFSLTHQRCVVHNVRTSFLSRRKSGSSPSPHCPSQEPLSSSSSSNELPRRSSAVAAQPSSSRDSVGLGSSSSPTVRETAYDADSGSSSPSLEPDGSATAAGIPSKASSSSNCTFEYANTVGILGGLAPLATVDFMRKIVEATDLEDETDHIPLVLCCDPHIRKSISPSLLLPMTNNMSSGGATSEMELVSVEPLLEKRRFLENAGAKCIVMPCHVSHFWYDQLAEGCSVPFLHIADCVVEELKAANLQPLEAGSKPKIGVLGTQATIAADFYQKKLRSQGFDVALPDQATMEHAVIPGIAALQRGDMEGARNLLRIAVQVLLVNAVNLVLLACHNTPTAFSADDPVLRKCIDPTDALARATIRWSQSMKGIRT